MNERGGRCSIRTRRWSRASYNVTDAGIVSQLKKQRFNSHQHSMRHRKYRHSTALSNYVWSLKDQDITFDIKWTVLRKAAAYRNTTRRCNLCIAEKLEIMKADKDRSLNRRSELVSKCRHENQFYLCNFPPTIPWQLHSRLYLVFDFIGFFIGCLPLV